MSEKPIKLSEKELEALDKTDSDGVGYTPESASVGQDQKETQEKEEQNNAETEYADSLQEKLKQKGAKSRTAFVKSQLDRYPGTVQFNSFEIKILDLGNEEDLKAFNLYKSQDHNEDYGLTIYKEELVFSEKSDNWKVYLELGLFDFTTPFGNTNE